MDTRMLCELQSSWEPSAVSNTIHDYSNKELLPIQESTVKPLLFP
jgi:hypothetical protein